ncbi:MAG: NUDIX hydrolase [Clostridia bacterium]|nr:NUDIX hydrolase [Clostridia bacterium]
MTQHLDPENLYVAVDILFLTVGQGRLFVLLSRRPEPPEQGLWALPGTFIGRNESADEATQRLTDEMLPGAKAYSEQLYTFSRVDRDSRGRVITIAYVTVIPYPEMEGLLPGSTFRPFAAGIREGKLSLTDGGGQPLDADSLAFDHGEIILTGIRRLQGKIDYSDIGLRFLSDPDRFTMVELEEIFDAVQEQKTDKSNFRRFIRSRYEETGRIAATGELVRQGRGRPAVLYRWNGSDRS